MVFGPLDKVHYDQKVTGESHLDDDIQLKLETIIVGLALFCVLGRVFWDARQNNLKTLIQADLRNFTEEVVFIHTFGDWIIREVIGTQLDFDSAATGDFDGIFDG